MKKIIQKYAILLIVIFGLQGLLKMIIVSQLQIILLNFGVEFNQANHLMQTILFNIPYLMNIIMASVILSDLIKNKVKGIPVVILTVFSHFAGVIFFLFLINNKTSNNDK
jgi:hypothetical protein